MSQRESFSFIAPRIKNEYRKGIAWAVSDEWEKGYKVSKGLLFSVIVIPAHKHTHTHTHTHIKPAAIQPKSISFRKKFQAQLIQRVTLLLLALRMGNCRVNNIKLLTQ